MSGVGTIMIVDDDPSNTEVLSSILEPDYEVLFAENGERALEEIHNKNPDLVILDVMKPGMDGYQICEALKKDPLTKKIPVIFITALSDADDEARGLEIGAIDYITKPIRPSIVQARVRNHLELKQARDLLERLSITDALTGLANRRHFDDLLDTECRRLQRHKDPLSLIMIDIDYFKNYNDAYGHPAGDACLKKVSEVINRVINRPQDLATRYGGEEFACVLPETKHAGAMMIANRIKDGVEALGAPNKGSSIANHVTVSLGVATLICDASISPEKIVKAADDNLYKAKEQGRNRVTGTDMS